MAEAGMTQAEIAAVLTRTLGRPVSKGTVASAFARAGHTEPAKRYDDEIPWRLRQEHAMAWPARMLRALGARRSGRRLSAADSRKLDSWLANLRESHAVVTYVPDTEQGFFYVDGEPDQNGIPVLRD